MKITQTELEVHEILYWYDGPLIFTTYVDEQLLLLYYYHKEDGQSTQYLAVPVDEEIVNNLKTNKIPILEALQQEPAFLISIFYDPEWNIIAVPVDVSEIPTENLPGPDVRLFD